MAQPLPEPLVCVLLQISTDSCVWSLQRADEIAKMEPRVAYYCRMYAVEQVYPLACLCHRGISALHAPTIAALQGMALPNRAPEITQVIIALMAKLESDKPRANLNPAYDAAYCENFACAVFERADKVDRAGRADKNTAMTFYAAMVFIEVGNSALGEQH